MRRPTEARTQGRMRRSESDRTHRLRSARSDHHCRLLIPRQFNPLVEVSALRLQKLVKSKNRFMRLGQSSAFAKRRVSDDSAPTPFAGTASASEPRGWGLGGHSPMQRGSSLGSLASLFGPSSQR